MAAILCLPSLDYSGRLKEGCSLLSIVSQVYLKVLQLYPDADGYLQDENAHSHHAGIVHEASSLATSIHGFQSK